MKNSTPYHEAVLTLKEKERKTIRTSFSKKNSIIRNLEIATITLTAVIIGMGLLGYLR